MAATAGGLHIVGDIAYRGLGWNGFYMVDIRSPTNLMVLARHKSVGQVRDLWVEGNYAYLAEGWEGLTVVDISQPTRTFYVGKVATRGQARRVEVSGDRVYVAEGGGGLSILGLPSEPLRIVEHPISVSAAAGADATLTIRAFGRETLRCQWYRGQTGDTSHPIAGATEASFTTPALSEAGAYWVRVSSGSAVSDSQTAWIKPIPPVTVELLSVWPGYRRGSASITYVEGNLAYIALENGALQIWDVTDLASPCFVGSYDPKASYLEDFCVSGKLAFLVHDGKLDVLDISKPETPMPVCSYTCSDTNAYISRVTAVGRHAYLSGDMFRVLDISDLAQPREVGKLSSDWASGIVVLGGFAYLASSGSGLLVLDISNPAEPRLVGSCATVGYANRVAVEGDFAYVAEQPREEYLNGGWVRHGGGLVVIDISNPANPRQASKFAIADETYPREVFVSDSRACCADGSAGLQIFDVSNPAAPRLLAGCSSNFFARAITFSGQRAYLSAGDAGLEMVDITTPTSPRLVGVVETAGSAQDVVVSGPYAYLADGAMGLQVLNISNPQRPAAIGNYRCEARSAAVSGSNVFLAPFQVVDVTDPTRPVAHGTLEDNSCSRVALATNVAYLTDYSRLRAVDVSDPAAPELLSAIPAQGAENGLATSGLNVFVGCGSSGFQIYDVNVPANPRRLGTYYADTPVRDVAVCSNFALVTVSENLGDETTDAAGLEVIDLADLWWPSRTSKIAFPVAANVALMAGSYACVTGDGLRVIDLGDPAQPVCVGQHQLGVITSGLSVNGNLAFVAADEYGLAIYRLTPQLFLQPPVRAGNVWRLSWLGGPGIRLQQTASLSQRDWQDVPDTDGANSVLVPLSSADSFFRLIRP